MLKLTLLFKYNNTNKTNNININTSFYRSQNKNIIIKYLFISVRTKRPSRVTRLRGFHSEAVLAKKKNMYKKK